MKKIGAIIMAALITTSLEAAKIPDLLSNHRDRWPLDFLS